MKKSDQKALEKESRNHFELLLPSKWITEVVVKDYGIDIKGEITDDESETTGKEFYVQLKSSGKRKIKTIISKNFKTKIQTS